MECIGDEALAAAVGGRSAACAISGQPFPACVAGQAAGEAFSPVYLHKFGDNSAYLSRIVARCRAVASALTRLPPGATTTP